jgi:hypothetical protein
MGSTSGALSETDLTHIYMILIEQSTSIQIRWSCKLPAFRTGVTGPNFAPGS